MTDTKTEHAERKDTVTASMLKRRLEVLAKATGWNLDIDAAPMNHDVLVLTGGGFGGGFEHIGRCPNKSRRDWQLGAKDSRLGVDEPIAWRWIE